MHSQIDKTQDILAALREAYLDELPGVIDRLEQLVLALKEKYSDEEYHELVRLVHNIKGNGGTMGFHILSTICHRFEDYLTQIEISQIGREPVIQTCFKYIDLLRLAKQKILDDQKSFDEINKQLDELFEQTQPTERRALVIDPSKSTCRMLCNVLEQAGFTVAIELSGLATVSRLLNEPFDLLVTAKEVPDLNGTAIIAAIRLSKTANSNIRSVMISSQPAGQYKRFVDPDVIIDRSQSLLDEFDTTVKKLFN